MAEGDDARRPMPPPEGWTLIEAAEALFPEFAAWCFAQQDMRAAFSRLGGDLTRKICRDRTDLRISGIDMRAPRFPRVIIPPELYHDDTMPEGAYFWLDIMSSEFILRMPSPQEGVHLHSVKVERDSEAPSATTHGTEALATLDHSDDREILALEWMKKKQEETVARTGRPMKVRALGQLMNAETGYPAYFADRLNKLLPENLRNHDRSGRSKRG